MQHIFNIIAIINECKSALKLAVPLIAAEVIYALNGFIATIMVAHLGKEQLAANALVWHIYVAVIIFFMGIFVAISVMVAQGFGAKDNIGVAISFKQGLIMAILLSFPMMFIMWISPIILVWTKQDPKIIAYAAPYFYSLIWSMLPLNIWVVLQQFFTGIGKTRVVMFMSMLAVPVEIFFYYAFLFGKFGLPKSGLVGIGYGLFASYSLITLSFGTYLCCARQFKIYNLFNRWWVVERKFLIELFRIGVPMGLMWFSEVGFFAVIAIIMGLFGITTLAAYQIADQYLMIVIVIIFAISQSTAVKVGNAVGHNNRHQLQLTFIAHIIIGLIIIVLFSTCYSLFPNAAISLDIDIHAHNYQDVAKQAQKFFPLIGILLIVDCIRITANGALRGLKDTKYQLFISIFGYWLLAYPAVYLLAFKLNYGGIGVWWGIIFGVFITCILLLRRFYRLSQHIDLSLLVTKK